MPALAVFESMFGNTEAVARAVADGLCTRGPLLDGELEPARRWGQQLAAAVTGAGVVARG